ncbi:uncharacterized protein LOC127439232 isoform X2 [Myxocyprinus asiaticus]|uniref:uncharacterized protein LOC127439232 isoform X2 n=1 Tax=Myxocyprinus asiaticus TaxID=70543 RepID=UPI002221F698|nr:uncharacterized protein LOC127439232 isoform X2 [Myxocyprinus asiaticus]
MYKYMYFSVVKMKKLCILFAVILLVDGVSAGYDQMLVSVNVGDSLTLHTGYIRKQEDKMTWYFNNTRIAQINGNVIKICTDVQCDETFRDRLQLNTQTGDLTITNITTEHTGMYHLQMINSDISLKIFNLSVEVGVPWADRMKKVNEGESVSLDSGVTKKQNDSITWYFNGIRIAQINGNTSEACTDVQCDIENERLRDRLKLNDRTGSLTITNARITDTGEYQLEISSSSRFSSSSRRRSISFSSRKTYSVTVIDPGPSLGVIAGIIVGVLLLVAAVTAGVFYHCRQAGQQGQKQPRDDQENDGVNPPPHQNGEVNESTPLNDGVNESTPLNDGVNESTPPNGGVNVSTH